MASVLRVLGAIRQSKTRDRAVSPAAQRRAIERWAEDKGYTIVGFTEDLSRSGKLSAFKRPELGPYLTDPLLIDTWDVIVTTKLDRANRNTKDFLILMDWCKEHEKQYVSLKEQIDMTTAQGRAHARDAASRAEWERDMASERRIETLEELAEEGRWPGGLIPFGLRAEERFDEDGESIGFWLVPDVGGNKDIADKMADMAIAGKPHTAIQRWLNTEGFTNSRGNKWSRERVRLVLHSESMAQVLGAEKHAELKLALHSRRRQTGQWTSGKYMLLRVSFCRQCGSPHYGRQREDRLTSHYRCFRCMYYVNKDKLEGQTIDALMFVAGDEIMHRKVVHASDQRMAERLDLIRQIETMKGIDADTSAVVAELEAKLKAITSSLTPGTMEWEPTDVTVAQHWATLTTPKERNDFLKAAKIRVEADKEHFKFTITEAGMIQVTHQAA